MGVNGIAGPYLTSSRMKRNHLILALRRALAAKSAYLASMLSYVKRICN